MDRQQIEALLIGGETQKVEFKAILRDHFILANLIGGFANSDGGNILIGIREPMEVIGCEKKLVTKLYERASAILKPRANSTLTFYNFDHKEIAIIEVSKSNNLVFSAGGVYRRTGESTMLMSVGEIKNKISVSIGQINSENNIESISKAIGNQSKIISELQSEIKESGNWKNKSKDYLIGGIIGAILGLLATILSGIVAH